MLQSKTSHWAEVPIGEILTHLNEQVMFDDMTEYITITVKRRHGGLEAREKLFGHEIKTKKQYRLHPGAFIISRVQCWHAAFAIVPDDIPRNMIASQNYDQFEISPQVDKRFFWWLSHSPQFIETVRSSASGVVIEKLVFNRDAWLQKTVPIPPLDEQHRIVAHIESLAARVHEAQRLREDADAETDALWASELQKLFEDYTGHIKTLDDYAEFISDGTHVTPTYIESGIPFVTVRNIANRKMSFTNLKYISQEQHEIYCKRVKAKYGDVLYTKDGTLGVPCFVDTDREFSFFVSVAIIKPKRDLLDGKYLSYILDAPQVHEQVTNTKTGAVLQHIVIRAIKAIKLPVPPLDEQRRIVAYLDGLQAKVNVLRELQVKSGVELSALMPSILDKAFKGEL